MLSVDVDANVSVACDDVASLIYFPYTKRSQTVQTATKRRFSPPASTSASASAVSLTRFFVSFCRAFAGINVDIDCDVGFGFGLAGAKHSLNGALSVQCCQTLSVLALSLSLSLYSMLSLAMLCHSCFRLSSNSNNMSLYVCESE